MRDLVKIARARVTDIQQTHWEGCERDHRECLIQRMADEIERLRAERDALKVENEKLSALERDVSNALPGVYYMDPPDGGSVPLGEQVRRMAVDAARYRWLRRAREHWDILHRQDEDSLWMDLHGNDLDAAIDAARGKE